MITFIFLLSFELDSVRTDVAGASGGGRRVRPHHQRRTASRRLVGAASGRPHNEHHRVEAGRVGVVDVGRRCRSQRSHRFLASRRLGGRFAPAEADDPQSLRIQPSGGDAQGGAGARRFRSHRPSGSSSVHQTNPSAGWLNHQLRIRLESGQLSFISK